MPFADLKGARIHYHLTAPSELPVLVFCNSLGTDFSMWDAQFEVFSKTFRILRYDTRGHGQSSSRPGSYTIEQLAKDLLGLLDYLNLPRVDFCSLSMGGLTGMWLGMHAPQRLHKIVLAPAKAGIPASKPSPGTEFGRLRPQLWSDGSHRHSEIVFRRSRRALRRCY